MNAGMSRDPFPQHVRDNGFRTLLLPVLLWALWMLPGCTATKAPPSSLSFHLPAAPAEGSLVVPGSTLSIGNVTVTDTQGGQRRLDSSADFRVTVRGGDYDAATREVRLSADRSRIPAAGYEIVVSLASAPEILAVGRYRPDFARIDGPEPADVVDFRPRLLWKHGGNEYEITEGTALIPGERYRLWIEARDRDGRTFSPDSAEFPIPRARLAIELAQLTAAEDWTTLTVPVPDNRDPFTITAVYGGDRELSRRLSFDNDPAIWQGPEPDAVSSVEFAGALAGAESVIPGESAKLGFEVKDSAGRTWSLGREGRGSHLDNAYPLPFGRVDIQVESGSYEPQTQVVTFAGARAMIGRALIITVIYGARPGRAGLSTRQVYQPDFLSLVPLMERDELSFIGAAGRDGRDGRDGRHGARGRDNRRALGRAGDGKSGGRGSFGQHGTHGDFGPNLRVVAREVRTLDAAERLVLFEVRAPGLVPQYYVRRLHGVPVSMASRGGGGGDGGDGGDGGRGGKGGNGYFSGDGGDGGEGGDGGNGGNGGEGGDITLILSTRDLEAAFVLDCAGGRGGTGGRDGAPGRPGLSGDILVHDEAAAKEASTAQPERGTEGNEGNAGRFGQDGNVGRSGKCTIETKEAAADMVKRVPKDLGDVILP